MIEITAAAHKRESDAAVYERAAMEVRIIQLSTTVTGARNRSMASCPAKAKVKTRTDAFV